MNIEIYDFFCNRAKKDILMDVKKNKFNSAIKKMMAVNYIERLNTDFKSDFFENVCIDIANKIIPESKHFISIKDNYVFCDSMMWDSHGLTQQYLKAIISMRKNILYIKTSTQKYNNKEILKLLESYDNSKIVYVPRKSYIDQALFIYESIINFRPEKIFIHSFSISEVIALYKLNYIERYRINLGNHLTWIGICCTDYMLEFNDFGYNVSVDKRGMSLDRLFKHPFYPIIDNNKFEGFPVSQHEKVIIYSGGDIYKIKDDDNTFLNIIKTLIHNHPNVVVYFSARNNDDYVKNFIHENSLENRFVLIGYRNDINEVFKHIDIFLQTYPIGGGLMEKYAIMNKKPILCFCTDNNFATYSKIDGNRIDVDLGTYKKAYVNITDFFSEANKLINDKSYRDFIGDSLNSLITTENKFNNAFADIIYNKKSIYKFKRIIINYDELKMDYNKSRVLSEDSYILNILSAFGIKIISLCPLFVYKKFFKIISVVLKSLKNRVYSK